MCQGPKMNKYRLLPHAKHNFELLLKKSILADFGWFSRLRGQLLEPKFHPIVPAMEQAIVRHILRNISGSGKEEIRAGLLEVQGKTSYFQKSQLWAQISPLYASSF